MHWLQTVEFPLLSYAQAVSKVAVRYDDCAFSPEAASAIAKTIPPTLARAPMKRQREFVAGRYCAEQALGLLGSSERLVRVNADRTPAWPLGFLGSISHCEDRVTAAAVAIKNAEAVGIDVEKIFAPAIAEQLAEYVADAGEWLLLANLPRALAATLLFSAKETVYKALYPIARAFLDFRDLRLTSLNADRSRWQIRLNKTIHANFTQEMLIDGEFAITPTHVYTACLLTRR